MSFICKILDFNKDLAKSKLYVKRTIKKAFCKNFNTFLIPKGNHITVNIGSVLNISLSRVLFNYFRDIFQNFSLKKFLKHFGQIFIRGTHLYSILNA